MVAPSPEKELLIYLAESDESVGILIAQDYEGLEKLIYYLIRLLRGSKKNYSLTDKLCVALMYAIQKLRHYMVTHRIRVITNSDQIKLPLQKPILNGRYTKWMLMLSELDIIAEKPRAIKSQALVELLKYTKYNLEEIMSIEDKEEC